jgi:hypothetical protein
VVVHRALRVAAAFHRQRGRGDRDDDDGEAGKESK